MNKFFVALVSAAVVLAACTEVPIQEPEPSSNPAITVGLVTEFDGCRLYAVQTPSRIVYVSHCGDNSDVSWRIRQGKTSKVYQSLTVSK